MHNTLSENLVSALAGEITPQEAMENTAKSWRKHIRKKGEDKMIRLINAAKSAGPRSSIKPDRQRRTDPKAGGAPACAPPAPSPAALTLMAMSGCL